MTASAPELGASSRQGKPGPPRRGAWWRLLVVAGLVVAGVWAVAGSYWLEPELSSNLDEQAYLHQADLLAHGHLAVEVPDAALARNFQPWFAAPTDHGYVFKYNLVWPAVLAVTTALSAPRLALAVALLLFLVGTYALTVQVLRSRRKALAAAVIVALSPLTIVQSTTVLSYVFFGALWTFAAACLLRGTNQRDRRFVAAAGALGAIAFCARPFDAVLALTPFVAWAAWRAWRDRPASPWWLVWSAAAAVPILVAQAVYNAYVTGVPWKFPYSLWSSTDRFGFGLRGLLPTDVPQTYYGPRQGVHGVVANLWAFNEWVFGGMVLVALAAVGLYVCRRRPDVFALASLLVIVPLGYFFFWGIANISFLSKAGDRFGPYYFFAMLVPLAAFAVEGAVQVWRWRRGLLVAAVLVGLVLTGVGTASALSTALGERDARAQPYDALDRVTDRDRPALVFLPGDYIGTSVLDRYSVTTSANGEDRFVVSNGNRDIDLVRRYPGYAVHQIAACDYSGQGPLGSEVYPAGDESLALVTGHGARARRLELASSPGSELAVRVTVDAGATSDAQLEVAAGTTRIVAPVRASAPSAASILVTVSARGVVVSGDVGSASEQAVGTSQPLTIRLTSRGAATAPTESSVWVAPIKTRPSAVTLLVPARTFVSPDFPVVQEAETCRPTGSLHVQVDVDTDAQ